MLYENFFAPMTAYGLIQFLRSGMSVMLRKAENYKLSRQWLLTEPDCLVAFILAHISLLLSLGNLLPPRWESQLSDRKPTCWLWHWCTKNWGAARACGSVPRSKCSLCLTTQVIKRFLIQWHDGFSVYVPASCRVFFSGLNATNKILSFTYCDHTHSVLQTTGGD